MCHAVMLEIEKSPIHVYRVLNTVYNEHEVYIYNVIDTTQDTSYLGQINLKYGKLKILSAMILATNFACVLASVVD